MLIEEVVLQEKPKVHNFKDLEGKKFGYLKVIGFAGSENGVAFWFCSCKCKNIVKVRYWDLKSGNTSSCGCFRKEFKITHGETANKNISKTYITWQNMLDRCLNKNNPYFQNYGGRGIKVCDEWLKFENFLFDMGERPENLSLDRKDNDKGYYKENCRWATKKQQANNMRSNRLIFFNGKTQSVTEWSRELKINKNTLFNRLNNGWSIERALTKNNK